VPEGERAAQGRPERHVGYWALAAVLIFVGHLGLFTIGLPLLLFGIALAILYPVRRRRDVF
jgi:hypothetical protein